MDCGNLICVLQVVIFKGCNVFYDMVIKINLLLKCILEKKKIFQNYDLLFVSLIEMLINNLMFVLKVLCICIDYLLY